MRIRASSLGSISAMRQKKAPSTVEKSVSVLLRNTCYLNEQTIQERRSICDRSGVHYKA